MGGKTMELLEEEIQKEIREISQLDSGSEKKSKAIDDLSKLYKLKIEENKNESEINEEQLKNNRFTGYLRLGIEAGGIVLPLIFYAVWMKRGFKFEQEGTYTSTTFRGLFNRFRPTK